MNATGEKPTTIALMPSTKERLLRHGRGSMSADEVLNLVLDAVEAKPRARGAGKVEAPASS